MTARTRITLLSLIFTVTLVACASFEPQADTTEWPTNIEQVEVAIIDPPAPIDPPYSQSEFECLRLNIYHEAGNQSRRGKQAVALVTINRTRTKHYPPTICGVVKQGSMKSGKVTRNRCQFSWYCDGKDDQPNLSHPGERKAWEESGEVANNVLLDRIPDFLGRATHYHATYVNPHWANVPKRYKRLTAVGTHIFYRDIKLGLKA